MTMIDLPSNWDQCESEYNRHYDPYDGPENEEPELHFCHYCQEDTETEDHDCIECGMSKTNEAMGLR